MQRNPERLPIWRETRHEQPRRLYTKRHRVARKIDNRRVRRWAAEDVCPSCGCAPAEHLQRDRFGDTDWAWIGRRWA
jgi:hypothetical protein